MSRTLSIPVASFVLPLSLSIGVCVCVWLCVSCYALVDVTLHYRFEDPRARVFRLTHPHTRPCFAGAGDLHRGGARQHLLRREVSLHERRREDHRCAEGVRAVRVQELVRDGRLLEEPHGGVLKATFAVVRSQVFIDISVHRATWDRSWEEPPQRDRALPHAAAVELEDEVLWRPRCFSAPPPQAAPPRQRVLGC